MPKLSWLFGALDRKERIIFMSSLGLNAASWVIAIWASVPYFGTDEVVALHKTVYFGIDLVGPWYEMLYLPLLGLIFILANFSIFQYIWKKEEDVGNLASWSTLCLEAVIVFAVFLIAKLN